MREEVNSYRSDHQLITNHKTINHLSQTFWLPTT